MQTEVVDMWLSAAVEALMLAGLLTALLVLAAAIAGNAAAGAAARAALAVYALLSSGALLAARASWTERREGDSYLPLIYFGGWALLLGLLLALSAVVALWRSGMRPSRLALAALAGCGGAALSGGILALAGPTAWHSPAWIFAYFAAGLLIALAVYIAGRIVSAPVSSTSDH
jgi:hypothetical protein